MQEIIKASGEVLKFLKGIPLSDITIRGYNRWLNHILTHCRNNGINKFTDEEAEQFIKRQVYRLENGELYPQDFRSVRRTAALLADQMQGRELLCIRKRYQQRKLNGSFENVLIEFKVYLSKTLSHGTIRITTGVVRQFLSFLEGNGVREPNKFTEEDVKLFVAETAPRHKASIAGLISSMKKFLSFLNNNGIVQVNAEQHLCSPASRRRKLLPCFTDDEVHSIFSAVDTSTSLGKRDYAIMRLAIGTGLRGVDIFALRLQDIDWRKNEISVIQSKTNVLIQLPLQTEVGNAIAEYILHARPESDCPFIFLRALNPHGRLSAPQAGRNIIAKYLEQANIIQEAWDGKKFHAFRRTAGTRLVRAGIPIESVSEILGQKCVESAKKYIALDDDSLRVCCLDISRYATGKEGLS